MRNTILALCLVAVATPAAAATNLIQNGDFTALTNGVGQITDGYNITTATGWTTSGYNFVMSVADQSVLSQYGPLSIWDKNNGGASTWNGTAPTGNFLAMDGQFNTASVSQTVSGLTTGQTYTLSFDYGFSQQYGFTGPTQQRLTASVDGSSWTSATESLASHDFSGWTHENFTFTATSTSEVVSFLAYGDQPVPPFALVSGVSLIAIPEPSTWAMLLIGCGGLGAATYRRARKSS